MQNNCKLASFLAVIQKINPKLLVSNFVICVFVGLHRNDVIPASCMASRRNSKYRSSVKPKPHASSP